MKARNAGRSGRATAAVRARRLAVLAVVIGACATVAVAAEAPAPPGSLRWPLDLPPAVVSSFGEYRYDHMHAGVDLSTGGAVGLPVRAVADGRVFRLKVEWRGYGRALYLKHADGRISVYGHLERYEDAVLGLERKVAQKQREAQTRYPGDIYLDPAVPVRRGQVIAYSGESGVGLPHLHFEMRGAGDDPIDPFRNGLLPPRQGAPVLESITATVAAPDAWIDGVLREKTMPLARHDGAYAPDGPLRVSGPFRLDLSAWAPAGGGRAGIRFLEARFDGETCYRLDFERFRFEQYPLAGLIYDHRFSRLGPTRMAWRLAALPGNVLAQGGCRSLAGEAAPGAYGLPDGAHLLEVVARDASGASSVARVCVLAARPAPLEGVRTAAAEDGDAAVLQFEPPSAVATGSGGVGGPGDARCVPPPWRLEAAAWNGRRFVPLDCGARADLCLAATAADRAAAVAARVRQVVGGVPGPWRWGPGAAGRAPAVSLDTRVMPSFLDLDAVLDGPGAAPDEAAGCPGDDLAWRVIDGLRLGGGMGYAALAGRPVATPPPSRACVVEQAVSPFVVRWLSPADADRVEGEGYRLEVPAGGRFFAGPLVVGAAPLGDLPQGLRAARDPINVAPDGECFNARATLTFAVPAGEPRPRALGIYRWDGETGRWSFEGGDYDAAASGVSLPFRRYGRFALLDDEAPPVVRSVRPGPGATVAARRPEIVASVEDVGEGLDHDGVRFLLDGTPIESEYDPDRGTARPFEPPRLSPGRHHLKVQAVDRAGNESKAEEIDFVAR